MLKKLLLLFVFLSVYGQKLKLSQRSRDRTEIFDSSINAFSYQEITTYRLPNETIPELYLINLSFGDFEDDDLSFSGNVLISIHVVEQTDTIILHNSGLRNVNTILSTSANVEIQHTTDVSVEHELLIVKTNEVLLKGSLVRLSINYQGTIESGIAGVYRGSYQDSGNNKRWNKYLDNLNRGDIIPLIISAYQIFHCNTHAADIFSAYLSKL